MKRISIFLSLFLLASAFVFPQNAKAKKNLQKYLETVTLEEFSRGDLQSEKIAKGLSFLDKAIEADKSWWTPYENKIQVYKVAKDYKAVAETFELWIKNGNSLSDWQKFSYACALNSSMRKEEAMKLFSEVFEKYANDEFFPHSFPRQEDFVAFTISGIIIGKIDSENLDYYLDGYIDTFRQIFMEFISPQAETLDEAIKRYSGA